MKWPADSEIRRYFDGEAAAYGVTDSGRGLLQSRIREAAHAAMRGRSGPTVEVGCGTGLFLSELTGAVAGGLLMGADFSASMLAQARRSLAVPLVQSRAQALPFRSASIGEVVCVNTIYNLPSRDDLGDVLAEFARVLRPRGQAVFEIRNHWHPMIRLVFGWKRRPDHPLWSHGLGETRELLARRGFEIARLVPVLGPVAGLALAVLVVAERLPGRAP